MLAIVYRTISGHILKKARLRRTRGDTGAVTLIQRFGSTLNLNIHLHMLFLDGAYLSSTQPPVFRSIAAPSQQEWQALLVRIAERIGRTLKGLLVREGEHSFLATDPDAAGPMHTRPARRLPAGFTTSFHPVHWTPGPLRSQSHY